VALACVIVDFPRSDLCDPSAWRCVIAAARAAAKTSGKPVVLLGSFPENIPEALALDLSGGAVVALRGLPEALCAIAVAAFIGRRHLPHLPPPLVLGAPPRRIQLISEAQAKQDLAKFGVLIPAGALVASAATVEREAEGLGFPVVLKTMGLAHKSEANAVHLNLGNLKEVQRALSEMPQGSFLIENMVQGAVVELLLGVVRDPAHGFLLTLAAGGVLTELLEDSASLLLPVTAQDVEHALDSLKVNKILRGFRGRPSGNRAAVIAAVLALQDYVLAHKDQIEEVEINPLIVTPNAAIAADALIRIGQLDDTDSD
jgi:acyl-CoA synthetase (NDP forming)